MRDFKKPATLLAAVISLASVSTVALAGFPDATVPEPGPMGLLILGAVALLVSRRFMRNK